MKDESNKSILMLNVETMPYHIPVMRSMVKKGYVIHVIHKNENLLTPYIPPVLDGVYYYNLSDFTSTKIIEFVDKLLPEVITGVGTCIKIYCSALRVIRKRYPKIPVATGLDSQWYGGKQWLNVFTARWRHRVWYTHVMVCGAWQYEYARKLGFRKSQIMMPYYSADNGLFEAISIDDKKIKYPKRFLFIGRFNEVKGLKYLLEAWNSIPDKQGWRLTLIGNGPLKNKLLTYENIEILDFMDQDALKEEMRRSGCFVLPSIYENWALVIHEAAAGGLPILSSDCVGATTSFLIEGYNGYSFKTANTDSLKNTMLKIMQLSDECLLEMSYNSRILSKRINPDMIAAMITSLINK